MTKEELLEVIKLLSALESWAFSVEARFPDCYADMIGKVMRRLSEEVLK